MNRERRVPHSGGLVMRFAALLFIAVFFAGCSNHGALSIPAGISVLPKVVQNGSNPRWVEFGLAAGRAPLRLVTGPDQRVWFPEYTTTQNSDNNVAAIDVDGNLAEYPIPTANSGAVGIAVGKDGNLWFTETYGNNIGKITTQGVITEYPILTTPNPSPKGITRGPDGNVWFTEVISNRIGQITPLGSITEFSIPTADADPNSIVTGSDKNLWFTESNVSKIGRITTKGVVTEFPLGSGTSPYGITNGPDGNLWITDFQANKIWKMTTQGVATSYQIPTSQSSPGQIVAGPDHNIWFTELDPNANHITQFIVKTGVFHEFSIPTVGSRPDGIAIGPDGNLWFGETQADKIGVYVRLVISVSPSSINFSGNGQNQTLTVGEKKYHGAWSATTSNPSVASVMQGNQPNMFVVTSVGSGTATIDVADTKHNDFPVPVSVP